MNRSESDKFETAVFNGKLIIEVIDQGVGIAIENQQKLFNEVFQVNPEKLQNGGGSGFGLMISKKIVDMHGGRVYVNSAGEGCGSTFTIELMMSRNKNPPQVMSGMKINRSSAALRSIGSVASSIKSYNTHPTGILLLLTKDGDSDLLSKTIDRLSNGNHSLYDHNSSNYDFHSHQSLVDYYVDFTSNGSSFKNSISEQEYALSFDEMTGMTAAAGDDKDDLKGEIREELLIVDDSPLNRKMLCKALKVKGYDCTIAEDGLDAINIIMKKRNEENRDDVFTCIVMDYMMPNMDGPTAVKHLRDSGYNGFIIGLTGHSNESDIDYYKSQGADEVFSKPLDIDMLIQVLRMRERPGNMSEN